MMEDIERYSAKIKCVDNGGFRDEDYNPTTVLQLDDNGDIVKYGDHQNRVASLKAEVELLRALIIDLDVKSATTRKNGTAYIQLSAKIETLISIHKLQQDFNTKKEGE